MAFETGTATDAEDLYDKLIAFLTTDTDLVAASQEWTVAWNTPAAFENQTDIVLQGPGLSGQDQVYVGIRRYEDIVGDTFYLQLVGMSGVLPAGEHYRDHINVTPNYVRIFLDQNPMTYWFIANGRRFIVIIKISTTFQSCYCGLFLPYADPLAYPYPMLVAGSAGPADADGPFSWRTENAAHTHLPWAYNGHYFSSQAVEASAWLMSPDANWQRIANTGGVTGTPVHMLPEYTPREYLEANEYDADFIMARMTDAYGGDRMMIPVTLYQRDPTSQIYGILDGAYRCQGVNNAAENLITVSSVDHLVVQNVYRTDFNDYWAIALE